MSTSDGVPEDDEFRPATGLSYVLLMSAAIIAALIQVLDQTIANVALPHMRASLGATQDTVSWILTSYIVASAVVIPASGWLSARFGQKRLFVTAVAGFTFASMLCGLANSIPAIVGFRILQGIFGAFLGPLAQTVMLDNTPPHRRASMMSIYGIVLVVGPISGPILGGLLTESFSWRWIFLVNVPLGLISVLLLLVYLPSHKQPRRHFDVVGFVLLGMGLAAFQLMLDRGEHLDWFESWEIWIELAVAISCLWMAVVHLLTTRNPLYHLAIFRDRNLVTAAMLSLVIGVSLMGSVALIPMMLQTLLGYPVVTAGIVVASRGVGAMCTAALYSWLAPRVDARVLMGTGFLLAAWSFYVMSTWSLDVEMHAIMLNGVLQGFGTGLVFMPTITLAFGTLPAEFRTDASGIIALSRSMGGSMGIAILIAMLSRSGQVSHADLTRFITPGAMGTDIRAMTLPDDAMLSALSMVDAEIQRQAAMIAYLNDFRLIMVTVLVCMPFVLLLRPPAKNPSGVTKEEELQAMVE